MPKDNHMQHPFARAF